MTLQKSKFFFSNQAFTLVELLIVIAILATLASAVVVVLNPGELLSQSRDVTRVQDIQSLNKDLTLYLQNQEVLPTLQTNTVYISVPDSAAPNGGNNCASFSTLPSLPSPWVYKCHNNTEYKLSNGNGWLPVNFSQIPTISVPTLPTDPVNGNSNFYTFIYGSSNQWALSVLLDSQKYLKSTSSNDGGTDPGRFETGNNLSLLTQASGLVGYWSFDEGSGTAVKDLSGNNNNGTWNGTGSHYAAGKVGSYAGRVYSATSDYIFVPNSSSVNNLSAFTVVGWMKPSTWHHVTTLIDKGPEVAAQHFWLGWWGSGYNEMVLEVGDATGPLGNYGSSGLTWNNDNWYFVAATLNDATKSYRHFYNGQLNGSGTYSAGRSFNSGVYDISIGTYNSGTQHNVDGMIDDMSVYNRVLTDTEIKAIYTAQK